MPAPGYILGLLLTLGFTLATWLQPRLAATDGSPAQGKSLLALTLGDARRTFANHYFVKADVYFHSGYYPSIFDQSRTNATHIAEQAGKDRNAPVENEEDEDFLGASRDWVEKFGRNFYITGHTHLQSGNEREMLPWLKLAAELDPQQTETYVVTAFWLREHLHRPHDAEDFLREGLRANPGSPEILYELGRLYDEDFKDPVRARNLWELADRKLAAHEKITDSLDLDLTRKILVGLARLEEAGGHLPEALHHLERFRDALPPEAGAQKPGIQKQIDELKQKLAAPGR